MKYYKITQPYKNIFHLEFKDPYTCGMFMARAQEFYESGFKEVKGKHLTFIKVMEIYAKKYGKGVFSYPKDWGGFNIPSWVLDKIFANKKLDINEYDVEMKKIYDSCKKKSDKFYLIASSNSKQVFKHEIAHGLFYLNEAFNKDMVNALNKLSKKDRKALDKYLKSIQYCDEVLTDEIQAYFSTGLTKEMQELLDSGKIDCLDVIKECKKIFNKYYKLNLLIHK